MNVTRSPNPLPDGYHGVIVGASIHMGKHDKHIVEFLRKSRPHLERLPSAFFSVSLAAHGDTAEAQGYIEQFEQETAWRPGMVALFIGGPALHAIRVPETPHHEADRSGQAGDLGTDTSRDYVYTEWDGVKKFAQDYLTYLAAERATSG